MGCAKNKTAVGDVWSLDPWAPRGEGISCFFFCGLRLVGLAGLGLARYEVARAKVPRMKYRTLALRPVLGLETTGFYPGPIRGMS